MKRRRPLWTLVVLNFAWAIVLLMIGLCIWRPGRGDGGRILTCVAYAVLYTATFFPWGRRVVVEVRRPDSGEIGVDAGGDPRCPDCGGDLQRCAIDDYRCRKCGEGWTMTPIADGRSETS